MYVYIYICTPRTSLTFDRLLVLILLVLKWPQLNLIPLQAFSLSAGAPSNTCTVTKYSELLIQNRLERLYLHLLFLTISFHDDDDDDDDERGPPPSSSAVRPGGARRACEEMAATTTSSSELDRLLDELGETLVVSKRSVKAASTYVNGSGGSRQGGEGDKAGEERRGSGIISHSGKDARTSVGSVTGRGTVAGSSGVRMASAETKRTKPTLSTTQRMQTSPVVDDIDSLLYDLDNVLNTGNEKAQGDRSRTRTGMQKSQSLIELSELHTKKVRGVGSRDRHSEEEQRQGAPSSCSTRCVIPTLGNARASESRCLNLHCTRCDNRILIFDGKEWRTDDQRRRSTTSAETNQSSDCVSYMFLRNVYPSREKMVQRMNNNVASSAYACQCTVRYLYCPRMPLLRQLLHVIVIVKIPRR